ncbi:beta-galactosidase GalB [Labilibacter marinus]|uniref:beta-galactosidase GalB n=1 Tax=Labilibacter marinus TaxID=1477105 RepID=UPI0008FF4B9E|nr:beta-galactosidase GalB [Labilibacter marinus]
MTQKFLIIICLLLGSIHLSARDIVNFNSNWKFARFGTMPDGTTKAEPKDMDEVDFDDSDWRVLNVPHDWGIEGPFRDDLPNRTGKLPWAGIGWYRKAFTSEATDAGKRVFIEFDGSMSNTKVWVNGGYVGEWAYGYSSFRLEITRYLKVGQENVIAVRLNNKVESSRWYPGGGIYRNVRLLKTSPVAIAEWGVFVSTPAVAKDKATVQVKTEVDGGDADDFEVLYQIYDNGNLVAETKQNAALKAEVELQNPSLWNLDSPHLYQLKTSLLKDGKVLDTYESTFGVREIEYTSEGFFLNGKKIRMNGVCQHHDLGPLGAAFNTRAAERQIEILKSFGTNAIRTAHNPPAPEFLDLCDRMGILVQVEAFDVWEKKKVDNDYAHLFGTWHERDLRNMVRRDRNHPCVVMWSTGNEMIELRSGNDAPMAVMLADIIRDEDNTRPTTFGCSRPEATTNGFEKTAEVFGLNYKPHLYEEVRKANPDLPIYGSETASTISSRGEYFFPVSEDKFKGNGGFFQVSSYDFTAPNWAYRADVEFEAQDKYPWVFGEFVWTGFDYIGEPTPYNKDKTNLLNFTDPKQRAEMKAQLEKMGNNIPPRSSYFGIVDLCGFPKDRYYLYQAKWRPELPMAHILPHWNWPERVGKVTPVFVYTSGDEAELFLNGKSLGRKKKGEYEYRLRWDEVKYQPGELKVVAYKNGKKWAEEKVKTTKAAYKVQLSADRDEISADGQDLSFVTVKIADKKGLMVPRTHNSVTYSITGPAEIIAVGNGDATNLESFQATTRKVFNGMALVVIRSLEGETGEVKLIAESEGLKKAELIISTK